MRSRGQTMVEYTVLIGVVTVALIAMTVYMKRALQGNVRDQADQVSDGQFYSPGATTGSTVVTVKSLESSLSEENTSISDAVLEQETRKDEQVAAFDQEPRRW
jgi:Flp pilus assembly pilin Flp